MAQDQNKPTDDKHLSERKLTPIRKWRYFLTIGSCRFSSSLPQAGGEGVFGPYSQKIRVRVCGLLLRLLTLFLTEIFDFPHPIYDLTKNLMHVPYWWKTRQEGKSHTLFMIKMIKIDTLFIVYLWPKRLKNQTLWGHTYPQSPQEGVTPRSGQPLKQNSFKA